MTDDAQTVRDALRARQRGTGSTRNTVPALDALDRLLADRDRLAARVKELEAALDGIEKTADYAIRDGHAGLPVVAAILKRARRALGEGTGE